MEHEAGLLMGRGLLQVVTFLIIASHSGDGLRWKPGVSLLAVVLAGSSAAMGVLTLLGWSNQIPVPQWLISVYALGVFVASVGCRGNLARLIYFRVQS